jgi:hypothetical protein
MPTLYVRARCLLHIFAAAFRAPLTETEAIRRMCEWAARDGERYRDASTLA